VLVFFFFFLLIVFFPSVLDNVNLVVANFFILLAFRRLISLQSLKASKKIFDASFWIIVAALFQFWSILYLVLVFISIIFMFLEIIEIGSYLLLLLQLRSYFFASILFHFVGDYLNRAIQVNFEINYFTNNYQNGAFYLCY
jgi:hypothetical protein